MIKFKMYYNYYMSKLLSSLTGLVIELEKKLAKVSTYTLAKSRSYMEKI